MWSTRRSWPARSASVGAGPEADVAQTQVTVGARTVVVRTVVID